MFSGNHLRIYLVGLCMGTADGVPGVSGGTIALIAGIYPRLIEAITALTPQNGIALLGAVFASDVESVRETLAEVDAAFLVSLGAGILTAVIVVTRAVTIAAERFPVALFGVFFGLIAASVIILSRQVALTERRHYGAALAGFLLAFVVSGNVTLSQGDGLTLVFVTGAIAISAMILPGISGALILILLGQHVYMSETLAAFTDGAAALLTGGTIDSLVEPGTTIAVFLVGAVVGLLTIARVVERALRRAPTTTMAFLVSLVVGALRAPITRLDGEGIELTIATGGTFVAAAIVGAVVLYGLDHYAIDVEIDPGAATAREEQV